MGKGPNSTPLVYQGKLYTLGVTAILSCFDAKTGALKWRKDYSPSVDTSKLFCGTAMSPVIDNGAVIVHVGDDRKGWMMAFDGESGKERWKWEGDGPGYASPIIVDLEGTRQLVTLTDRSVVGIATDTGKLLWKFPYADEWNENIITPVLYQKSLIISGVRKGTRAIKVTKIENQWAVSELWHNAKVAMYMSSPVVDGDYLYGLSTLKKGQFFCLNAQTGETVWTTEGRNANQATVVAAKNYLFLLTDDAELLVAAKSPKGFEQVARYTVADSPTWSHPLILGKQLLIKDKANLTLWSFE
jgi:outer membrane protein assembly factor BamB